MDLRTLVDGRECGECTACCKHLTIDSEELKKLPGILCEHCTEGKGCGIYEQRPSVCRNWYCAWRMLDNFDDGWRPDRSGVMVELAQGELPPGYNVGLKFTLIDNARYSAEFVRVVSAYVDAGAAVFILVQGKPGHASGKTFINDNMHDAAKRRSFEECSKHVAMAVQAAANHNGEPIEL